jgi:UDP-glucuronate 4-epimerase
MTILITGAAGFIGYHVAEALLARGDAVVGVDNLNPYYDVRLKEARLERLRARPGFDFHALDISDRAAVGALFERHRFSEIVHLAAQAGVRHSLVDPYSYVQSNVMGHLVMLEAARQQAELRHFVYASSSSVYGGSRDLPFRETDRVDTPVSLYAATKRADELMSHAYAHLFGLPQTGLRFFTVYGPWGRPDMAYFSFARAIMAGEPITLYDGGRLKRDFTYVDDIVAGVIGCLAHPPPGRAGAAAPVGAAVPAQVLNIGNHRAEEVRELVALLERALGRRAIVQTRPAPATEVEETYAEVTAIGALTGFQPSTSLAEGIPRFVAWFRGWNGSA